MTEPSSTMMSKDPAQGTIVAKLQKERMELKETISTLSLEATELKETILTIASERDKLRMHTEPNVKEIAELKAELLVVTQERDELAEFCKNLQDKFNVSDI